MFVNAFRRSIRQMSSKAKAKASSLAPVYPFSSTVNVIDQPPVTSTSLPGLLKGKSLMSHLSKSLVPEHKRHLVDVMFSRRHPERVAPGSVLTVHLTHAPFVFSGVLIAIRRRGHDTSFTLRNVVQRVGVEMACFVGSPGLERVEVLKRIGAKVGKDGQREGKRSKRAKLFYLRHSPDKMTAISAGVRGK